MALVDLHAHTTHSDGHDTPSALVKMAVENGVAIMAVTDHDNLGGLDEALAAGREHGVAVIPGVEVSTGFHGGRLHIVGLGVDRGNAVLRTFLKTIYDQRKDALLAKLDIWNERQRAAGKPAVDTADFTDSRDGYFNHERAARYIVRKGLAKDQEKVIKELIDIRAGNEFKSTPAEAIAAIHAAGGLAILAHPLARSTSLRKLDPSEKGQEELLKELVGLGLDGLEGYQSEHGPNEVALALDLASRSGLLVSAGSDWHGAICDAGVDLAEFKSFYPEHLGGLNIATEMVAPLLARLGVVVDKR